MRKFTLVISMLAMGSFVFGQQLNNLQHRKSKMTEDDVETTHQNTKRDVIGAGDIIFNETFDSTAWHTAINENLVAIPANMPNGWTAFDATGNNYFIRWSTTGARGAWTSPADGPDALVVANDFARVKSNGDAEGTEKGFLLLEIDFYNTTPTGDPADPDIPMDTYVQSRAIDASANPAVSIYFEQFHRFCCAGYSSTAGAKLLVSTDQTNWTQYSIETAAVNATPKNNPSIVELSLSAVAAGQSTVYLRFYIVGESAYYWSIDDVTLYEPMPYDTRMTDYWVDYAEPFSTSSYEDAAYSKLYSNIPYYSALPAVQNFVSARALATNYGSSQSSNLTLTSKIMKGASDDENAVELYSVTSAPVAVHALGATDTLAVDFDFDFTEVAEAGSYHHKGILATQEVDDIPENNTRTYDFHVTQNLFGYANPVHASTDRIGPGGFQGYTDGDGAGAVFMLNPPTATIPNTTLPAPHVLKGINVHINNDIYNRRLWESGEVATFIAEVYEGTFDGTSWIFDENNPKITSESVAIDSTMKNTWVYIPFLGDGASENITPSVEGAQYLAAIRFYTGDVRFFVGADKMTQSSYYGVMVDIGEGGFGGTSGTLGISMELICDTYGTNPKGAVNFMVEHEDGTPAEGAILTFHTQDASNESVATDYVIGGTGTVNIDQLRMGTYTYNIAWGEDNLKIGRVTISSTDVKNFKIIINDDNTVAVANPTMELSMYPNPANNSVTIESSVATSRIVVSNIVGQVVDVINNPAATQTISVSDYATGVYMVTIFDNNGNKVTKRLIKQ